MDWGMGFKHGAHFRMFEQKNVMTSLQQLCCILGVLCVAACCVTENTFILYVSVGLLALSVLAFIAIFGYLSVVQPKLLQSERHIEKMAIIEQEMADGKNIQSINEKNTAFVAARKKVPKLTNVLKEESK